MKKLLALFSALTLVFTLAFCFSASADNEKEKRVVIDNVVYELTCERYINYDYGDDEHYIVTDFFDDESLAETTTKINIVDEINGIEVKGIDANDLFDMGMGEPEYSQQYPSVKTINIPNTVKHLGCYTFSYFPNVEQILLPADLEHIGAGAFYNMQSLKSITLPSKCTSITSQVFYHCKNLEEVNGEIDYIGDQAFAGCEKLTKIDISPECRYLGTAAFSGSGIKKIVLPANIKMNEYPLDLYESLEKLVFENKTSKECEYISMYDELGGRLYNLKSIYIKTIPTKGISFSFSKSNTPKLKNIYFVGSEATWDKLVSEKDRGWIANRGINVTFYYRHSHNYKKTSTATCVKSGTVTYKCECGAKYSYKVDKNKEGHKYSAWKVVTNSTYTVQGYKTRTCSRCGKVQKKTIPQPVLDKIYYIHFTPSDTKTTEILVWHAVEDATGYRICLKESGKYKKIGSTKGKNIDIAGDITYSVKNLELNTKYTFAVQPYYKDANGKVAYGEYAEITTTTPKK